MGVFEVEHVAAFGFEAGEGGAEQAAEVGGARSAVEGAVEVAGRGCR